METMEVLLYVILVEKRHCQSNPISLISPESAQIRPPNLARPIPPDSRPISPILAQIRPPKLARPIWPILARPISPKSARPISLARPFSPAQSRPIPPDPAQSARSRRIFAKSTQNLRRFAARPPVVRLRKCKQIQTSKLLLL